MEEQAVGSVDVAVTALYFSNPEGLTVLVEAAPEDIDFETDGTYKLFDALNTVKVRRGVVAFAKGLTRDEIGTVRAERIKRETDKVTQAAMANRKIVPAHLIPGR